MAGRPAHYLAGYDKRRRQLVAVANADPSFVCWRCGRTRAEHPRLTSTGKPNIWTAGHVNDGEPNGELRPEMWTCNSRAGAIAGNRKREPTSRQW